MGYKSYIQDLSTPFNIAKILFLLYKQFYHNLQDKALCLPLIFNQCDIISINVNRGLHHDFEVFLEKLAPEKPYDQYHHNTYEDNADTHLKRTIMGREVVVAITNGKLDLGPWEQIFYGEFDGQRRKRVLIKIIGN